MFFLALLGYGHAFDAERHIPTIMIAQRRLVPSRVHAMGPFDPIFFEKFFKEPAMPIVIRTSAVSSAPFGGRTGGRHAEGPLFKTRTSIEDRVNDTVDGDRSSENGRLFKPRTRRGAPKTGGTTTEKKEEKSTKGHSLFFYLFVLALFVLVGLGGYQFGKAAESRNYVRVPSTN